MMDCKYTKIDYENWPRRELFEFFSAVSYPFYSVTYRLDVTKLCEYTKKNALSFYYALTWLVTKAINSVEAFRCSMLDGELIVFDERVPSCTDLHPGSDCFHIVTIPAGDDMAEFCRFAKAHSAAQTEFIDMNFEGPNLIFISSLPWVDISALTHERDFNPDDAVPRVAWGKYTDEGGRKTLGMSLELNHRFTDGRHIGLFNDRLRELIDAL